MVLKEIGAARQKKKNFSFMAKYLFFKFKQQIHLGVNNKI